MSENHTRRRFLQAFGITAAAGLAGCSQQLEPSDDSSEDRSTGEPQTGQDSETDNGSNPEETTEDVTYPETGTLQVNMADGSLGPDGVFEGDVELNIPLTEQELVEKYHHNRLQKLAETDGKVNDRQTLRELPHNILNEQWRVDNIHTAATDASEKRIREAYNGEGNVEKDLQDFIEEKYINDENFLQRYPDSKMPSFLTKVDQATLGGPDSGNDYIRAAILAATEYHAAEKMDNMTTSTKTNDGFHGTVWFLENTSWTPTNEQNVYILEPVPLRNPQLIDFDETENYPHNQVFTDAKNERDTTKLAWKGFARWDPRQEYNNLSEVDLNGRDEFREAVKNPGEYGFKQFTMPSILAEYINNQATPEGELPELQGAELTVTMGEKTNIEYELA